MLEVDAVGENLLFALLDQDPEPLLAPQPSATELGEDEARIEETKRLASEVSVRREVMREIGFDVGGVGADPIHQVRDQPARHPGRATEEEECPAPCDEPQGHLEAARPVDAQPWRVGSRPLVQDPREGIRVGLVPRQPVSLTETDEPVVAVQLPDDLAVAYECGVERVESAPVAERGAHLRDRIEMPVHRIAEGKAPVPEQIEAATAGRVGQRQYLTAGLGHADAQEPRRLLARRALEKPPEPKCCEGVERRHRGVFGPVVKACPLEALPDLLPATASDLCEPYPPEPSHRVRPRLSTVDESHRAPPTARRTRRRRLRDSCRLRRAGGAAAGPPSGAV